MSASEQAMHSSFKAESFSVIDADAPSVSIPLKNSALELLCMATAALQAPEGQNNVARSAQYAPCACSSSKAGSFSGIDADYLSVSIPLRFGFGAAACARLICEQLCKVQTR